MDTTKINSELLEHAVLNQIEADFNDKDFTALSELLGNLIQTSDNKELLYLYLGETAALNLEEGKTAKRY